jgi:hypothetical protein
MIFTLKNSEAMKTISLIIAALLPALCLTAQQAPIPNVDLRDINGKTVSSSTLSEPGVSTMVVFWNISGEQSCDNLETLAESWDETLRHQGIKMVAVCVDCNGSWTSVKPIVNGNGWDFETLIDVNGDLKRAMSVGDEPCAMLFDGRQNLVCRYNSITPANGEYICNNVLEQVDSSITAANFRTAK